MTKFLKRKTKVLKGSQLILIFPIPIGPFLETILGEPVTPGNSLFICDTCAYSCVKAQNFKSALKDFKSFKSKTSYLGKRSYRHATSTPTRNGRTGSCTPIFCSPVKKRQNTSTLNFTNNVSSKSFITKATNYIKYYTAFRILLKNSKAAKTAFVKLVRQIVQQEMKTVKHNLIPLSAKLSQQSINKVNWGKTLTNIELPLPVLSTTEKSALVPRKAFSKLDL